MLKHPFSAPKESISSFRFPQLSTGFLKSQKRMHPLRKKDYPGGKFTLAFVGYGDESEAAVIELTYNWETSSYNPGNGFGHIAIGVDDIYKMCEDIRTAGGKVTREPGPMKHGSTVIAFVEDPDGYQIELIRQG